MNQKPNVISFERAKERLELRKRQEIIEKICERTDKYFNPKGLVFRNTKNSTDITIDKVTITVTE